MQLLETQQREESEEIVNARLRNEWGKDGLYLQSTNKDVNEGLRKALARLKEEHGTLNEADALYIELSRQGKVPHLGTMKW